MKETFKIEAINTLTGNACSFRIDAYSKQQAAKMAQSKNPQYLKIVSVTSKSQPSVETVDCGPDVDWA